MECKTGQIVRVSSGAIASGAATLLFLRKDWNWLSLTEWDPDWRRSGIRPGKSLWKIFSIPVMEANRLICESLILANDHRLDVFLSSDTFFILPLLAQWCGVPLGTLNHRANFPWSLVAHDSGRLYLETFGFILEHGWDNSMIRMRRQHEEMSFQHVSNYRPLTFCALRLPTS